MAIFLPIYTRSIDQRYMDTEYRLRRLPRPQFFQRQTHTGRWLIVCVGKEPSGNNGEMKWHLSMSVSASPAPDNHPTGELATQEELEAAVKQLLPKGVEWENHESENPCLHAYEK